LPGLFRRLVAAAPNYLKIAWHGLVSPLLGGRESVAVSQAVILSEQRVLLAVRRDLRGWELPGGHVQAGESSEDALIREVREETGLDIAVERRVGEYVRTGFRPYTASVYTCRITGGALRPSVETPVVRWFESDELPDTLFPWFREPLADALAARPEPVARCNYQGAAAVWAGFVIDLRMRLSDDRAGLPESPKSS
jgi:8-oxo-dGTP pyrophosphatase MutT (NUDIX family)